MNDINLSKTKRRRRRKKNNNKKNRKLKGGKSENEKQMDNLVPEENEQIEKEMIEWQNKIRQGPIKKTQVPISKDDLTNKKKDYIIPILKCPYSVTKHTYNKFCKKIKEMIDRQSYENMLKRRVVGKSKLVYAILLEKIQDEIIKEESIIMGYKGNNPMTYKKERWASLNKVIKLIYQYFFHIILNSHGYLSGWSRLADSFLKISSIWQSSPWTEKVTKEGRKNKYKNINYIGYFLDHIMDEEWRMSRQTEFEKKKVDWSKEKFSKILDSIKQHTDLPQSKYDQLKKGKKSFEDKFLKLYKVKTDKFEKKEERRRELGKAIRSGDVMSIVGKAKGLVKVDGIGSKIAGIGASGFKIGMNMAKMVVTEFVKVMNEFSGTRKKTNGGASSNITRRKRRKLTRKRKKKNRKKRTRKKIRMRLKKKRKHKKSRKHY